MAFLLYATLLVLLNSKYTLSQFNETMNDAVCRKAADVIFVLDASSSIYGPDFKKQLAFVETVIRHLDISPSMVRCGLITYANHANVEFGLRTYSSAEAAIKAVSLVTQPRGQTYTDLGLRRMSQIMADDKRSGVPQIGIVITDGDSDNKKATRMEAEAAHKAGITMFALGIGRKVDDTELGWIASQKDFMFNNLSVDGLGTIASILSARVCNVISENEQTPEPVLPPKVEVCHNSVDVIFVLDASSSIYGPDFLKELEFMKTVIQDLDIDPSRVRCGLVTYGDQAHVGFGLRTYSSAETAKEAVSLVTQLRGKTRTDLAIRKMMEMMAKDKRFGVPQIGIVITDGDSDNTTATRLAAEAAHKAGITMFAVGIGMAVNETELSSIASQVEFVFKVESCDGLERLRKVLTRTVCYIESQNDTTTRQPAPPHNVEGRAADKVADAAVLVF